MKITFRIKAFWNSQVCTGWSLHWQNRRGQLCNHTTIELDADKDVHCGFITAVYNSSLLMMRVSIQSTGTDRQRDRDCATEVKPISRQIQRDGPTECMHNTTHMW